MSVVAELPDTKTPATRLLDMLLGWSNYVDSENAAYPDTLSSDELADLYQSAGRIAGRDYPDADAERDAVCRFVTENVLPLLLR